MAMPFGDARLDQVFNAFKAPVAMLKPDFDPQPTAVQIGRAVIYANAGCRGALRFAQLSSCGRLTPLAGQFDR